MVAILASPAATAWGQQPKQDVDRPALLKAAYARAKARALEDYRVFFNDKEGPKTTLHYWAAIDFEIQTGKFDVAAYLLGELVQFKDKDAEKELLKIEAAE